MSARSTEITSGSMYATDLAFLLVTDQQTGKDLPYHWIKTSHIMEGKTGSEKSKHLEQQWQNKTGAPASQTLSLAHADSLSFWLGGCPSQERDLRLGHRVRVLYAMCGEWPRWPGTGGAMERGMKALGELVPPAHNS